MDGTREVWVDGSTGPWQTVNITEIFETAVESLKTRKKYVTDRGRQKFEPAEFFDGAARRTGSRLGVPVAVGFEVHGPAGG